MTNPEVRIRANPADHSASIALFRDGQWWTGTVNLTATATAPIYWPLLQPAITTDQARRVIAAIYDQLQPDAFADRMDSAQTDLTHMALVAMADAGIKVIDHPIG